MKHVWMTQEKHLLCIQDSPGVDLYTTTGTLEKGGTILKVLKCARGSSSLESFHRHQCAFVPGWSANAAHMQMNMLDGGSRLNMNRAREAVDHSVISQTRLYDIRLMSSINSPSQRVLSIDLLSEFEAPGRPSDELIAVDYLLDQSGKGDLRPSQTLINDPDNGQILPEVDVEEATEEENPEEKDQTISNTDDIEKEMSVSGSSDVPIHLSECERCGVRLNTGEMVMHVVSCNVTSEHHISHKSQSSPGPPPSVSPSLSDQHVPTPMTSPEQAEVEVDFRTESEETRLDQQGYPGWEKVDALGVYLVALDTSLSTALSKSEVDNIVELYSKLSEFDKAPTTYALKTKKNVLPGPWRASRKRAGSSQGVQASERLYMTHGQAAESPATNRISECVCLHLLKMYSQGRNRPKDNAGKVLPLIQSIVYTYSIIQQFLADSPDIQDRTNLVLVTVNNTTVSTGLNKRQKRQDRDALLQGTELLEQVTTATHPLPPAQHAKHGHETLVIEEPENRQGECVKRPRRRKIPGSVENTPTSQSGPKESAPQPALIQGPWPRQPAVPGYTGWFGWPPFLMPPYASTQQSATQQPSPYPWPSPAWPPSNIWQLPGTPPAKASNPSIAPLPSGDVSTTYQSRQREWRRRKAIEEDEERVDMGMLPKKRHKKTGEYRYICNNCQKQKCKATGHTQVRGKWYCPSMGITVDEWKRQMVEQRRDQ